MKRIDLFPLRMAKFVFLHFWYSMRPSGPRERLLAKCRGKSVQTTMHESKIQH